MPNFKRNLNCIFWINAITNFPVHHSNSHITYTNIRIPKHFSHLIGQGCKRLLILRISDGSCTTWSTRQTSKTDRKKHKKINCL